MYLRMIAVALAVAAFGLINTSADAASFNPSNQGGNKVIFNAGGNLAFLTTLQNTSLGDTATVADALALQQTGPSVIGMLAGDPTFFPPAGFQGGGIVLPGTATVPALFSDVSGTGVEVSALSSGTSVFDAVFLVFDFSFDNRASFGNAVFGNGTGGTVTFGVGANPVIATNPIPLPASLPLMFAGLAGLGIITRKRRRANA